MLKSPCTTNVVQPITVTMVVMNSLVPTAQATWLRATKNQAPAAAPKNCTATTAKRPRGSAKHQ